MLVRFGIAKMRNVIQVDTHFFDGPAVVRSSCRLGCDTTGMILRVWAYCATFFANKGGSLGDMSGPEIESLARWHGDPGKLIEVFLELGILVQRTEGFAIPGWDRIHDGKVGGKRKKLREETRASVLAAGKCAVCGSTEDLTVDHKMPVVRGGSNNPKNLQCLCGTCNSRKQDRMP